MTAYGFFMRLQLLKQRVDLFPGGVIERREIALQRRFQLFAGFFLLALFNIILSQEIQRINLRILDLEI